MSRRFKRHVVNPLTEIAELQLHVDVGLEEAPNLTISADVRVSPAIEEVSGRDFKYGPRRAFLAFQIAGCEATRGVRYNDSPPEPLEVTEVRRETITREKGTTIGVKGNLDVSANTASVGFSVGGGIEAETKSTAQIERTSSANRLSKFVKSRPNLRWEFEPRNVADPASFLDDTYLSDHTMFNAAISDGANQVSVEGSLYCRKSDFSIIALDRKLGDSFFLSRNRESVMNLVIQKAIKEADISAGLLGEMYIVLSKCNIVDGD